ncbi:MAG: GNAT family N-acetyltransferase [Alphaproteobacteria bacterium]|nr:GNAT family N-acetyltransferase [Alphaproteobacteria bacterium]
MPGFEIEKAPNMTQEIYAAVCRLLPQLSDKLVPAPYETMSQITGSSATHLLLARGPLPDQSIAGMLTLVVFRIPSGIRVQIEDVVVDEAARGHGLGRMLTQKALDMAREMGAGYVDLTSNPSRLAANKLYQSMGFAKRETNVYRFKIA